MANSINGFSGNNSAMSVEAQRSSQHAKRDSVAVTTSTPQSEDGSDEVQITSTASQLASLGQTLSAMSPLDSGRVAHLSQAIADGTYSISADKIASGLMQSDQTLAQIGL